jgi:hypothetical protein
VYAFALYFLSVEGIGRDESIVGKLHELETLLSKEYSVAGSIKQLQTNKNALNLKII